MITTNRYQALASEVKADSLPETSDRMPVPEIQKTRMEILPQESSPLPAPKAAGFRKGWSEALDFSYLDLAWEPAPQPVETIVVETTQCSPCVAERDYPMNHIARVDQTLLADREGQSSKEAPEQKIALENRYQALMPEVETEAGDSPPETSGRVSATSTQQQKTTKTLSWKQPLSSAVTLADSKDGSDNVKVSHPDPARRPVREPVTATVLAPGTNTTSLHRSPSQNNRPVNRVEGATMKKGKEDTQIKGLLPDPLQEVGVPQASRRKQGISADTRQALLEIWRQLTEEGTSATTPLASKDSQEAGQMDSKRKIPVMKETHCYSRPGIEGNPGAPTTTVGGVQDMGKAGHMVNPHTDEGLTCQQIKISLDSQLSHQELGTKATPSRKRLPLSAPKAADTRERACSRTSPKLDPPWTPIRHRKEIWSGAHTDSDHRIIVPSSGDQQAAPDRR